MKDNNIYHNKIKNFLNEHSIDYKHMVFDISCHSVEEASIASKEDIKSFVKNICMIDDDNNLIVAIV